MEQTHLMTPAYTHLTIGGHEVKISKGDLSFSSTNNTSYTLTTADSGHREFLLTKGSHIENAGQMVVSIIETPDGSTKSSIDRVNEELAKSRGKGNPKDYAKTVVFVVSNSHHKSLIEISFEGYVKEIQIIAPEKEGFVTHLVTIVEYNGDSFKVS